MLGKRHDADKIGPVVIGPHLRSMIGRKSHVIFVVDGTQPTTQTLTSRH